MHSIISWITNIRTTDEDNLRRGRTTVIVALVMICLAVLAIPLTLFNSNPIISLAIIVTGITAYLIIIAITRLGYVTIGGLTLIAFITLPILAPIVIQSSPTSPLTSPFYLILSILVAGLTVRPVFIWLVLLANIVGLFIAWSVANIPIFTDPLETPLTLAALFLQVGTAWFTFIGGQITDNALNEARRSSNEARQTAAQLAELNTTLELQVEQRTKALQTALHELEQRTAEQARLLAENEQQRQIIRELSVPVLPVQDTTLVMPLIGALDTARLVDMQRQALNQIERTNARELLIDITGVPVIDTQVAKGLLQLVEAARLMGTQVILVGIRPEVAETLVTLGIDLHHIRTYSTLRAALARR